VPELNAGVLSRYDDVLTVVRDTSPHRCIGLPLADQPITVQPGMIFHRPERLAFEWDIVASAGADAIARSPRGRSRGAEEDGP
jgi:hypothetical protein